MLSRLAEALKKPSRFYHKEIWQPAHLSDTSPRGWLYAFLRVISITWTALNETKIASRAAALSFSSLLGLGPLVAIAVLVAGFVLGQNADPGLVANKLNQLLHFVAPQLAQMEALNDTANGAPATAAVTSVNPGLVDLIQGFISGAHSGSAGTLGALSLILIVLLLFKSIDDAFNDIWGVHGGRPWLTRIVFYWTILTLGAVLFFAAVTLLGAGAFLHVFKDSVEKLPGGHDLLRVLGWSLPAFSVLLLVIVLTVIYRVIPHTRVFWRAAFAGALVVVALLMLNNYVAFFYLRRILLEKSLYGSLAILPVLMLGLYVFWLYVLIGGVISYAVQNVHFRHSQAAWSSLSEAMRERLSLVVLLTICRRFQACLPPVAASQLSIMMKVPTQILNESFNRLVHMKLLTAVPAADGNSATDFLYQPARPLSRINLLEFKNLDENLGDDPVGDSLQRLDPLLQHYQAALGRLGEQEFFQKSLEELIAAHPFDESRPPFKTLAAR